VKINGQITGIIIGLTIFFLLLFINPFHFSQHANVVLSVAALMIIWWIIDCVPNPVVALLPLIMFPLFSINTIKEITNAYSDPVVFLFMGGFFIGIAIEKWNLHKRLALNIIKLTGTNGNNIIIGFIISTAFLSLWLSNTATTMMMYPIAISMIHIVSNQSNSEKDVKNFSMVLMLSIAYSSNFAIGTVIGTPTNIAYINYIEEKFNYEIGFLDWMKLFIPLTVILMLLLYWVMVKLVYPNNIKSSPESKKFMNEEIKNLQKISKPEQRVGIVFLTIISCWIFKDAINYFQQFVKLDDTNIALMGAVSLFIIPSGKKENQKHIMLLDWKDADKMAWGILLLFGGGIAIANALESQNLMQKAGMYFSEMGVHHIFVLMLIITTFSIFFSELISNVAQVMVLSPVVTSLAISMKLDPLLLGIPMTIGASCASMLPMSTPPNSIVYASNLIKMKSMLKIGFILNVSSIIIITLYCYFIQPLMHWKVLK